MPYRWYHVYDGHHRIRAGALRDVNGLIEPTAPHCSVTRAINNIAPNHLSHNSVRGVMRLEASGQKLAREETEVVTNAKNLGISVKTLDALIRMFADDTKVALKMESAADGLKMQQIINNLVEWADKWAMSFNAAKCKILHVGRNNPRNEYTMKNEKIAEVEEEKDLGVWVDTTLKSSKQCAAAAKAANFALGQMQMAFHYRTKNTLVPIYKTFIRPKLEFSVAAWNPWMERDKKELEKVQERMVRLLSDARGNSYED